MLVLSCKKHNGQKISVEPDILEVSFFQNGKQIMPSKGTLTLKKAPFDIVFNEDLPFDIMVNASFKDSLYKASIKPEALTQLSQFYSNATIAEDLFNKDEGIYVSENSTNVWYYEDENNHMFNRLSINDGYYKAVRSINKFRDIDTDTNTKVGQINQPVYFVFLKVKRNGSVNDLTELKRLLLKIIWEEPSVQENKKHFKKYISKLQVKSAPCLETSNFDSFIEEEDYENVDIQTLRMAQLYPEFNQQDYGYKAIQNYRLNLSQDFYTIVVTIKKGDNEIETQLINYNFEGKIIDNVVVSYDEIAEGMFKNESKINDSRVLVHQVVWEEEPKIEQETYQVLDNGTFDEIDSKVLNDELSNFPILNIALEALNLNLLNVKTEFIKTETHPDNPDDFIVIVPEVIEESEHYLELNSHILIVNGSSGGVTHKTVVKGLTSEGDEDVIKDIKIDTEPYLVNEHTHAFGILISQYGNTTVTPWKNENLELFVKSGDTLNSILQNFNVMEYGGEIISDCEGGDTRITRVLNFQTNKTNGYYDIIVETEIIDSESFPDGNGDCNTTEKHSTETKLLKFNGETYNYDKL